MRNCRKQFLSSDLTSITINRAQIQYAWCYQSLKCHSFIQSITDVFIFFYLQVISCVGCNIFNTNLDSIMLQIVVKCEILHEYFKCYSCSLFALNRFIIDGNTHFFNILKVEVLTQPYEIYTNGCSQLPISINKVSPFLHQSMGFISLSNTKKPMESIRVKNLQYTFGHTIPWP